MKTTVSVHSDVERTARVVQTESIFEVPPSKAVDLQWVVDMPIEAKPWSVGLIVGPSGCGKSTVARNLFGPQMARFDALTAELRASGRKSLLDTFPPGMPIQEIVALLSSVGFSSPPAWVRPFSVLSNGEQFRVMMARALAQAQHDPLAEYVDPLQKVTVVDEFTSVVDRTVAQVGASAIAKAVRRNGQQFIAVTCHEDVEAWLQPDWTYRPAEQCFAWRLVQPRPRVGLTVHRVHHSAWAHFRNHHYMSHELNKSAVCFAAFVNFPGIEGRRLAAFDAFLPHLGRTKGRGIMRSSRLVCLPDYQGLGIAMRLAGFLSSMWGGLGKRATINPAHPALISSARRNKDWKMTSAPQVRAGEGGGGGMKHATDRNMASFEYVGPMMDPITAQRLHSNWTTV